MYADVLNIGLGFLEGVALILSPCILPILPLFLAGSLTGSKKRPLGIIIGFVLIFSLFTFFSRKLVNYVDIDANLIRALSYVLLFVFGIMMVSTYLTEKFAQLTRHLTNTGSSLSLANDTEGGMVSGFIFGSLIALIWTPCAGPILAAVIVQTVIQKTNFLGFCTIVAFGLGATIPMLAIVVFGRELMKHFSYFKRHANLIRKGLGMLILLSVSYLVYSDGVVNPSLAIQKNPNQYDGLQQGLAISYTAPPISGIEAWINSQPLQMQQLRGKVVLIDFWTYSCINCIRTLPYLQDWYHKYQDKGFVIIGIHSPEFEFEKNFDNVKKAVVKHGILYPIALDNQFVTWRNFSNVYWPAHYLINKDGRVVYTHFGEGDYDITESNIRFLLGLDHVNITDNIHVNQSLQSPETYLGYARAQNFSSPEPTVLDKTSLYSTPAKLVLNGWALQGKWAVMSDKIISEEDNAKLTMYFHAKKVFIVMGNATSKPINVRLLLNGNKTNKTGKEVIDSDIKVDQHSIYHVIELDQASSNLLQIISAAPGLEIYTLTFGN